MTSNFSLNFKLPKKTQLQLYGYCITRNNDFQLQNGTNGNISLAMQHIFLNNHLTVSVNLEDIFNLNNYPINLFNQNVYIDSFNKHRSRYLKFGLRYDFGRVFKHQNSIELQKNSRVD